MPELPEVETIRRGLHDLIIGKQIAEVNFDWPKGFPNTAADVDNFMIGAKIVDVRRRAKVLMIDLSSKYTIVIHLKMTGQLVYIKEGLAPPLDSEINSESLPLPLKLARGARRGGEKLSDRFGGGHPNESLIGKLPDKSTRVTMDFSDGSMLFFNDQRKFGWMRLMPTITVGEIDFMRKVGPEPLEDDFTFDVFKKQLVRKQNSLIKAALLDQTVLAGVGNIYADESLWGAGIYPGSRARQISIAKLKKLHEEIRYVLNLSIEKGGSTDRNYIDAEGKRGSYLQFARVFRREGQDCPRCGAEILKIKLAGRGTHYCPVCQKPNKEARLDK